MIFRKFNWPIIAKQIKTLSIPWVNRSYPTRSLASFSASDFNQSKSRTEKPETLLTKFSKHVAGDQWNTTKDGAKLDTTQHIFQITDPMNLRQDVKKWSFNDLLTSIYAAKSHLKQSFQLSNFVNVIDDECVRRIDELSAVELQQLLTAFMYLLPNRIIQLDFYQLSVLKLAQNFNGDHRDFVTVAFFLGMWKKNDLATRAIEQLLNSNLLKHLDQLSTLDFAVVCNAAFKTSAVTEQEEFRDRLVQEINLMKDEDIALLVTFIKSCRLNRMKTDVVVQHLKEKIMSGSLNNIDLTGVIHLFAYFAENLVKDNDVIDFFLKRGGCYLNETTRIKDIAKFLWCFAHLGVTNDQLNTDLLGITKLINQKFQQKKYRNENDVLVDTCLALWMLGYKDTELAIAALGKFTIHKHQDRVKLDSRKILLAACLEIEADQKVTELDLFDLHRPAPKYLTKHRPMLTEIFDAFRVDPDVKYSKLVVPIAELNIAGILAELQTGEKVCVEVLDQTNKTSDGFPFGLMNLKIRLLKAKDVRTIVVSQNQGPNKLTINECFMQAQPEVNR